jgi:hypothetical protein
MAESFFATLETELFLHEHGGRFDNHHQARLAVFDWSRRSTTGGAGTPL